MSPVSASALAPLRIALYVAISSENERYSDTAAYTWRSRTKQAIDIAAAFTSQRPKIHFHGWQIPNSNKGDILIREAVKEQLTAAFAPRSVMFREIQWGRLTAATAQEISDNCDLFVIGGSGYLFPNAGRFPKRFLNDGLALSRMNCPKIALGIGYNIILGDEKGLDAENLAALKAVIGKLDHVSVRDARTAELVAPVAKRAPQLVGDPVLLYKGADSTSSVRSQKGRLKLGVNIALHGPVSAGNVERNIDKLTMLLRRLCDSLPVDLHYIAHAPSERLAWWLLRGRGVRLQWHDPRPVDLPGVYRMLDAHIAQMMHSSIVAMSVNLPVTAFAYDRKTQGLFDLMGLSPYCVPVVEWNVDDVFAIIARMIEDRVALKSTISHARERIAAKSTAFMSEIRDLVTELQDANTAENTF